MKISILTPSFNQGKFIEQNILSVINQNYDNFEHIIIDGGSTDETLEILKKYPHLIWVSEPDEGQADALNKGLKIATGDIIGWINSDDYYLPNAFNTVLKYFKNEDVLWLIGNIMFYYNDLDKCIKINAPSVTYKKLLKNPDIVKQQGAFFRRSLLNACNGFNKEFQMVMDYDLWVRLSKIKDPLMINEFIAVFRFHLEQKTNPKNIKKQLREINFILQQENAPFYLTLNLTIKKYIYILKYIMKKLLIRLGLIDKIFENIPLSVKR